MCREIIMQNKYTQLVTRIHCHSVVVLGDLRVAQNDMWFTYIQPHYHLVRVCISMFGQNVSFHLDQKKKKKNEMDTHGIMAQRIWIWYELLYVFIWHQLNLTHIRMCHYARLMRDVSIKKSSVGLCAHRTHMHTKCFVFFFFFFSHMKI